MFAKMGEICVRCWKCVLWLF